MFTDEQRVQEIARRLRSEGTTFNYQKSIEMAKLSLGISEIKKTPEKSVYFKKN